MANMYVDLPTIGDGHWKAPVTITSQLPASGNTIGDTRVALDTDTIYVWNGTSWIAVATPGAAIAIDGLIGDVSASGPGVVPATVNYVGGQSAASVAAATTLVETSRSAALFLASPATTSGMPSFRAIVATDVPTLNQNTTGTASNITATSNSTLTTLSALSLPYSQVTGAPAAITALTGDATATGPGSVPLTLATVNSNVGSFTNASITVNAKGLITAASNGSASSGTVTSVALSTPGVLYSVSGSPITTSGTLALNLISQAQNTVLAGPTSGSGNPSFRLLTPGDIPTLNQNTTGTAANITATSNSTLTTLSALSLPYSQLTGTPTVNGFTPGSVLFASGTGAITQDNAQFFWDNTNFTLGLGTATPQAASILNGINTTGSARPIWLQGFGTSSSTGVRGDFARGTIGSPSAAQTGDTLNFISGRGYGASQPAAASTGVMQIVANENFTNTSNATSILFKVTPTGSTTNATAMTINSTGNILMDTSTDNGTDVLQIGSGLISGYAKLAGSTSGYIQQQAASTTTNYAITWPSAQASGTQVLSNNGSGVLSWSTLSGTGTVTSVGLSAPGVLYTVSGSPVTTSGTLTLTLQTQAANTVFAGPTSGAAATPTFRSIVSADVPPINLASTSNGGVTGTLGATNGGRFTPVFNYYSSSTTMADPGSNCSMLRVRLIGGGGGGGSGAQGATSTSRSGGGGGSAGTYYDVVFPYSTVTSWPVTITIGATANGGAGQTNASTQGIVGTAGNNTSFGTYVVALGGGAGAGGAASTATTVGGILRYGGSPSNDQPAGVNTTQNYGGGSASANSGSSIGGGGSGYAGSGGAGGSISSGNASVSGSTGLCGANFNGAQVGFGASPGNNGPNGTNGDMSAPYIGFGGSGGGGSYALAAGTSAYTGGNGGLYGGGGGGGSATINGTTSGAGGNGAQGFMVVIAM